VIGTDEIPGVEGNHEVGSAFHGQFQDEVVLWVGQERPPKEKDGAQIRTGTKKVQHAVDVAA
jgi:hypothetical protein